MSTGGIECTFPEKLPSLSNDDRDKMVKESLDQEKRHISEQDDGSQNPKSHVKSKRLFSSSLATAMNLRKSFPLSSEENSSQNNTLFITNRVTASKEVLDPNFNSSAITHTNTNGTKP